MWSLSPWTTRRVSPRLLCSSPGLQGSDSFSQPSVLLTCLSKLGSPLFKGGKEFFGLPYHSAPMGSCPALFDQPSVLKVSPTLHRDHAGRQPSSHRHRRCGGRSLLTSLEALLPAARTPSSSLLTPGWMGAAPREVGGAARSWPQPLSQLWTAVRVAVPLPPLWLVRLAIFHAELRKLESIGAQSGSLWAIFKL